MNPHQAIRNAPNSVFYIGRGEERRPDYRGMFVYVATVVLEAKGLMKNGSVKLTDLADNINVSSIQRGIALEAARRRDGDTFVKPAKAKPAKLSKRKLRALKADPIEGRGDARVKPTKIPVDAKEMPKSVAKARRQKANKRNKANAKKADKASEVDPIDGRTAAPEAAAV